MTEPPEPCQPSEGDGGADDPIEVPGLDDLLDQEWLEEMDDDLLIDEIAQGVDHRSIYDELPDEEWELQDQLHDARDELHDAPLPEKTSPEAVMAEFERRKKAARPLGPRTPESGGPAMPSAMEQAEQLRSLGNQAYERALLSLNGIDADLDDVMTQLGVTAQAPDEFTNQAAQILGEGHPGRDAILNAAAAWSNKIDPLKALVTQLKGMVSDLTGPANGLPDGFNSAASQVSGGQG